MLAVGVATTVDARALRHLQPDHARLGPARAASSAVSVDVQRAAWAAEAQAPVATMVPRQRVVPAPPQSTAGDVVTRSCAALGLAASGKVLQSSLSEPCDVSCSCMRLSCVPFYV